MATELKDLAPQLLQKERAGGDVDPNVLTPVLRGGQAKNDRRKELVALVAAHPVLSDRDMMFRNHTDRYLFGLKKAYHYVQFLREHQLTSKEDQLYAYAALGEPISIDVHRSMFIPTLENQADADQQRKWLPLAREFKIIGAYAQTELGHGSNVQGIETTANYDINTQEFIIHSPTLTSRKWWPGGLGKTATHAIVHARLFVSGKDRGVQAFLVQIRSLENHEPLKGVEVGDIGPKVGFNAVDNGYCAFNQVRIPRDQMMMRYAKVLPDGTFVQPKSDKLVYLTMVQVRAYLLVKFANSLGMATTISTRFSAARIQGRKAGGNGEHQVLDYQNQQFSLFPLIAMSYATVFASQSITKLHDEAVDIIKSGSGSFAHKLAALHAVSSGMKAWLAEHSSNGVETCRRLCGGHGFSQASNLAHIFAETVGACTFEGTFDVLVQQHARYLLKALRTLNTTGEIPNEAKSIVGFLANANSYCQSTLRWKPAPSEDEQLQHLVEALRVRATRAVVALAKSLQVSGNNANACMVMMTRASVAHTELMLVESFTQGLDKIPPSQTKSSVSDLCSLFTLWLIGRSAGDFRHENYMSSAHLDALSQQLLQILPKIRRNAVLLTDAWDFTDFELNSAIGRYDGDIYNALVNRAAAEPLNATTVPREAYENYIKPLLESRL